MADTPGLQGDFDRFEQHLVAGSELLRQSRIRDAQAQLLSALQVQPGNPHPVWMESFQLTEQFGYAPHLGVVDGDHKLIHKPKPELYDLKADPGERADLAGDQPGTIKQLEGAFDKLSPEMQNALSEAGAYATRHHCEFVQREEEKITALLQAENGIVPTALPQADLETLEGLLSGVQNEWAKSMDDRGLPGTQVLNDFKAALAD